MRLFRCLGFIVPVLLIFSCDKKTRNEIPPFDRSYSGYIGSFTSGVVSKGTRISVNFTNPLADSLTGEGNLSQDILEFDPEIEGQLSLDRKRGLEFTPNEDLTPGQIYTGTLHLSQIMRVPDSLAQFSFGFQVLHTEYEWGTVQLIASPENQMKRYALRGNVRSADDEALSDIENLITVEVDGTERSLTWNNGEKPRQYTFEVDSLQRKEQPMQIELLINDDATGTETMEDRKLELPALGDFRFLGSHVVQKPNQHIQLNFSDPIKKDQDLQGLVTVENADNLRFEIDNTRVLIYPDEDLYSTKTLTIFPGIKNILNYKYTAKKSLSLEFINEKPQVEIPGDGNILPVSDGLTLPFRAISLKAVNLKVLKIAGDNILQFLQTNDLNGSNELYRVGEVVATQTIDLKPDGSLKSWHTYSANLSKIITPQPGALYRLYISFSKSQSVYECQDGEDHSGNERRSRYYNRYEETAAYDRSKYYFQYPEGYSWRERDNPCDVSYYRGAQFATRNLMGTNLGIIVKRTENKRLDFTLNGLKENRPVNGADISILNYQGKELAEISSDKNGWADWEIQGRPYFVVAEKNGNKIYQKLNEGLALSVSEFDVDGTQVQDGLKGFIYGERGVWRPGDTLFLNFMMEDEGKLPKGHPVHFKLLNPRGVTVATQMATKSDSRIYSFTTHTKPTAETGNYTARIRVGDREFEKRIRIETVKPNRLTIDLDFESDILKATGEEIPADLSVNWLTGVPAAEAEVDITANISQSEEAFEDYPDYNFIDPVGRIHGRETTVFKGQVGKDGKKSINLQMGEFNSAPSMLRARFVARAFEGGGNFSTEYFDAQLAPYDRFVGLKTPGPEKGRFLITDRNYKLGLRTVDSKGVPVSVQDLEVKIYRIGWHWWYQSEDENLAEYINSEVTHLVSEGKVSTFKGKGEYEFKVEYPKWGRFLVRVCDPGGGHCSGEIIYFDYPAGKTRNRPGLAGATMLKFDTQKDKYSIGEEMVARIPAPKASRVLMAVENGNGIIKKEWLEASEDTLEYRLKVTPEMAPNIYLSAHLLQPHAQTTNDRPMRLYGVLPVAVYDPSTRLNPEIETKDSWQPGTKVEVTVSENKEKAMDYTLAVVDDGLLNLTRFTTPDPWNHFYAKEALGVMDWDIYNSVIGAFGGALEQVMAIGGDEELKNMEDANLDRFTPMVRHFGPFHLEKGQSATHKIDVPNYVGSARVMVVSADGNHGYGNASKSVKVKKPLMVLTTLPRLLSPGDDITLPVTVFAMDDDVRKVKLNVNVEGKVQISGAHSKTITFKQKGEKVVDFNLKVPEDRGAATVRVKASGAGEKAHDHTQLKVRIPNPPVTRIASFNLNAGADTTLAYKPIGITGTNSLNVEASTMPPINLSERLDFLLGYPHGCTEQTISRVFPLLYLDDFMKLDASMKRIRQQNVQIALEKIYQRQSNSGGIRYWPGGRVNSYISTYAGHFMSEAKANGFQVAEGMLARWRRFQKDKARDWRPEYIYDNQIVNALDQAYRLYVLAKTEDAELGAMNRLRERDDLSAVSLWLLAASYSLSGQKEVAENLAGKALNAESEKYVGRWYYGSRLRNDAMALTVLKRLGRDKEAFNRAKGVAKRLNSRGWYSTHSLAYALKAIAGAYQSESDSDNLAWSYTSSSADYSNDASFAFDRVTQQNDVDDPDKIVISNNGEKITNFVLTRSGIPIDFKIPATSSNLDIRVTYQLPNGKIINPANLQQGQNFEAVVKVSRMGNAKGYNNMALTQLVPTGWEILNDRLTGTQHNEAQSDYDYRDIRDDRVYTYFDLSNRRKKSATFKIRLNATYAGRYYLPPVQVQDMYNNDIQARTAGRWVKVNR